jgi:hypothetical protein
MSSRLERAKKIRSKLKKYFPRLVVFFKGMSLHLREKILFNRIRIYRINDKPKTSQTRWLSVTLDELRNYLFFGAAIKQGAVFI